MISRSFVYGAAIAAAFATACCNMARADNFMDPNSVYDGHSYVAASSATTGLVHHRKLATPKHSKRTVSRKYYREYRVRTAIAKKVDKIDTAPHPRYYLSPTGLAFIKAQEGLKLYIYDDLRESSGEWNCKRPVGTLTIGYGHTIDAAGKFAFKCGARIDDLQAEDLLLADLADVEASVNAKIKREITQGQYDAIVSITFNCGPVNGLGRIAGPLNAGRVRDARYLLGNICTTSKGRRLQGLVNRRRAEVTMWDTAPEATAASDVAVTAASAPITLINTFRRMLGTNPTKRSHLWCADAQNLALKKAGYATTNSSAANSFRDYGHPGVGRPGDIALMAFGRRGSDIDHVGTVTGRCSPTKIKLISGNDAGSVRERCISEKYVVDYRSIVEPVYAALQTS